MRGQRSRAPALHELTLEAALLVHAPDLRPVEQSNKGFSVRARTLLVPAMYCTEPLASQEKEKTVGCFSPPDPNDHHMGRTFVSFLIPVVCCWCTHGKSPIPPVGLSYQTNHARGGQQAGDASGGHVPRPPHCPHSAAGRRGISWPKLPATTQRSLILEQFFSDGSKTGLKLQQDRHREPSVSIEPQRGAATVNKSGGHARSMLP